MSTPKLEANFAFYVYVILCVALIAPNLYRFLIYLTCFSPFGQMDNQEAQISLYEKGDAVGKEEESVEVTLEDHDFIPSEESDKSLLVEQMDVNSTFIDDVHQGCVINSKSG